MRYKPTELEEELAEELEEAPGTLMLFFDMRFGCELLHFIPVHGVPPDFNTTQITKDVHETF